MRTALCTAVLCALFGAELRAEGSDKAWAYELADELMSPYCPGRALSECPSAPADEMRRWIIEQERAGVSRDAVEAALFARFGDQLLQAPRAEGLGLWAYLVPAIALLLGGATVLFFLVRQRRPAAEPPAVDEELVRKLDAELERSAR